MKVKDLAFKISMITTVILVLFMAVFAQGDGRIAGTVTDATGAIVPGATVSVTNEATGETRTTTSSDSGTFLVVSLKPSSYTVSVAANNFETLTKRQLSLLVGQQLNLDMKLQAKGVNVEVNVVAGEESLANTSSASLSANVNPREVEGLPINGR